MSELDKEVAPSPDFGSHAESGPLRISLRTAAILLAFTLVFTALMAGTFKATAPMLEASAQAGKLRLIGEVLSPDAYDNDLLADSIVLPPQKVLNTESNTRIYRARKNGVPVALVLEAAARDGYSGRIELIAAVGADGRMQALRVTQHRETPGLGDYIDPKKDRNKKRPWISQFDKVGYETIAAAQWRVRKDGGRFDQMNGATISARAVVNASGRALAWTLERREALFALAADQRFDDVDGGRKP